MTGEEETAKPHGTKPDETTQPPEAENETPAEDAVPLKAKAVKKKIRIKSKIKKEETDFDFHDFGTRRQGRLYATQALYFFDIRDSSISVAELCSFEYEDRPIRPKVKDFAVTLIRGSLEHLSEIDEQIEKRSHNWKIERIGHVDKAILRFSIFSLLFQPDVPPSVVIDEAVEIAKLFCEREAYKFINGILDGIIKEQNA